MSTSTEALSDNLIMLIELQRYESNTRQFVNLDVDALGINYEICRKYGNQNRKKYSVLGYTNKISTVRNKDLQKHANQGSNYLLN